MLLGTRSIRIYVQKQERQAGDNMQQFLKRIEEEGISPDLINDIISAHQEEHDRMVKLYERYKASDKGVPILTRSIIEYDGFDINTMKRIDDKVNNKLNNAFDADIIDTKIGYFLGHPISYGFDDKSAPGVVSPTMEDINIFNLRNHVEDLDAELGKVASICGVGARLLYVDLEGNERIKNIDPWQVVFFGDEISEPKYSLRYYKQADISYAEFYDDSYVTVFKTENGEYKESERIDHMFKYNPLYGVANNKELQGDTEKVLALIDAYDRTLSDASNEIEQLRLAYLVMKGITADDDTEKKLKYGKIIELLGEHDDVKYLTKDVNDDLIEHHLDRLEKNIIRFAKSVDFSDEAFAGQQSGEALKHKLRALESKCITSERKFVTMLRYQYKVLFSARAIRSTIQKDDYLKMFFVFKRNNPIYLLEEAQATNALRGNVSEETRLAALSIVDDVQYEIEQMKKEQEEAFGMYDQALGEIGGAPPPGVKETPKKREPAEGERTCSNCGGTGKVPSKAEGDMVMCPECRGDGVESS
jgi:SPP1 family phage portal protein